MLHPEDGGSSFLRNADCLEQGWQTFLRAHAQTDYKFWKKNSLACPWEFWVKNKPTIIIIIINYSLLLMHNIIILCN